MIRNIFDNFRLIWAFVKRDLKGRYVGSIMGLFWSVIHPLSQILVFSVIFGMINRGAYVGFDAAPLNGMFKMEYVIFLCSALLPWIAFQDFMTRVTGVYVSNANLIKKIQFPEEILVIQELISSLITLLISLSLFFLIITIFGGWTPSVHILLLPGILVMQIFFSLGIAYFMATLNVFLRDIGQIMAVVLMTWFWLTPIVYPFVIIFEDPNNPSFANLIVPRWVHTVFTINPWYYLSKWYREIIMQKTVPQYVEVLGFLVVTIVVLAIGTAVYKGLRKDIPDMI